MQKAVSGIENSLNVEAFNKETYLIKVTDEAGGANVRVIVKE